MEFIKFPSLENTYKEDIVMKAKEQQIPLWYVTEKLHGSNFSFSFDKELNCKLASRNGFTDGGFFGFGNSDGFADIQHNLSLMALYILNEYKSEQVVIYGELVGDGVQKGVFYTKGRDFYIFRIIWIDNDGEWFVIDYHSLKSMADRYNVKAAPFIFEGSLSDCLSVSNQFDSLVAGIKNNICEGVVIQPVYQLFDFYPILKNKNDKFKEKSREKREIIPKEYNQEFVDSVLEYINNNFIDAVISKIGKDVKFIPDYIQEFNQEMIKEIGEEWSEKNKKDERKYLTTLFIKSLKNNIFS